MITKFGKRFLASQMAGVNSFSGRELALGIGSTAVNANGNDTKLEFEFYRLPVVFGSTDIQTTTSNNVATTTYSVVYKTTIPQDVVGQIYEIGLFPSNRTSIGVVVLISPTIWSVDWSFC